MAKILSFILLAMPICAAAYAQEQVQPSPAPEPALVSAPSSTWSAGAEAGAVATTGNTETRNISTKFRIENDRRDWRYRLNAEYLNASDKKQTTAEKASTLFKTDYKMTELDYLFGVIRYETDRFSGYRTQSSESAGYGRRFTIGERMNLEAEVGAGARQTRYVDGTKKNDNILRFAGKFIRSIGTASEFREEAFTELARNNTHTESVTSLKSRINGNLSMKAAYTMTHNSRVPEGIKKTDTITSLTLVYDL